MTAALNIPEPGDRIELVHTTDPHTKLRPGAQGTAGRFLPMWGLMVKWDDGSILSLLPEEGDAWRVL
jgi:hypothetical protein